MSKNNYVLDNVRYTHDLWHTEDLTLVDGVKVEQHMFGKLTLTFSNLDLLRAYDNDMVSLYEDYMMLDEHRDVRAYWFTGLPNKAIMKSCKEWIDRGFGKDSFSLANEDSSNGYLKASIHSSGITVEVNGEVLELSQAEANELYSDISLEEIIADLERRFIK